LSDCADDDDSFVRDREVLVAAAAGVVLLPALYPLVLSAAAAVHPGCVRSLCLALLAVLHVPLCAYRVRPVHQVFCVSCLSFQSFQLRTHCRVASELLAACLNQVCQNQQCQVGVDDGGVKFFAYALCCHLRHVVHETWAHQHPEKSDI
jgi:hypothetical protein